MLIALTGASGFVGRHVKARLIAEGHQVKSLTRKEMASAAARLAAVRGCDWLVNCAGQKGPDPDGGWPANEKLPALLYEAASVAGCSGMVHLSSVAALGSTSEPGLPIDDKHVPAPDNDYGRSKLNGDEALLSAAFAGGTRLSILRPPLLFAADAGGLFGILRKAALAGLPLPLSGIEARRSITHVDNLAAAVLVAMEVQTQGCFVVTDSPSLRPADVYRLMLQATGRGDRCFSLTRLGRKALSAVLGTRRSMSLFASCECDGTRFAALTGVDYPLDLRAAIAEAMRRA